MKKTKKLMTCVGLIGTLMISASSMYLMYDKKKRCINEMMAYFNE